MLHKVQFLFDKNPEFIFCITNSIWKLAQIKIKNMFLSNKLKISIKNINL